MTDDDPDSLPEQLQFRCDKATRDDVIARSKKAGLKHSTWLRIQVCKMLAALRQKEAKKP